MRMYIELELKYEKTGNAWQKILIWDYCLGKFFENAYISENGRVGEKIDNFIFWRELYLISVFQSWLSSKRLSDASKYHSLTSQKLE